MFGIVLYDEARYNPLKQILPDEILGNHFLMGVLGNPYQTEPDKFIDFFQFVHV